MENKALSMVRSGILPGEVMESRDDLHRAIAARCAVTLAELDALELSALESPYDLHRDVGLILRTIAVARSALAQQLTDADQSAIVRYHVHYLDKRAEPGWYFGTSPDSAVQWGPYGSEDLARQALASPPQLRL